MDKRLEESRDMLIEKLHNTLVADKITSTEQLLNCAKTFNELSGVIAPIATMPKGTDSI